MATPLAKLVEPPLPPHGSPGPFEVFLKLVQSALLTAALLIMIFTIEKLVGFLWPGSMTPSVVRLVTWLEATAGAAQFLIFLITKTLKNFHLI
jgi:hypothetical protein